MATAVRELPLDLDAFEGPFDLLLTLVLREELQLRDVDVAEIVLAFLARTPGRPGSAPTEPGSGPASRPWRQEVSPASLGRATGTVLRAAGSPPLPEASPTPEERLGERGELDLEGCGEFLVLAAALLELKARGLFPDEELDLDDLDPEDAAGELAERLATYRRFRAAAAWLQDRLEAESDRFFRLGAAPLAPAPARPLAPQDPQQLVAVLRLLGAEPPEPSLRHLVLTYPPLSRFLDRFRTLLRSRGRFSFDREVDPLPRVEQIVAFLALLELRKNGEVAVGQTGPFEPIAIWNAASGS